MACDMWYAAMRRCSIGRLNEGSQAAAADVRGLTRTRATWQARSMECIPVSGSALVPSCPLRLRHPHGIVQHFTVVHANVEGYDDDGGTR